MTTRYIFALLLSLTITAYASAPSEATAQAGGGCYGDLDGDGDVDGTDYGGTHAICEWIGGCDLKFWQGFFNCFTA